MKDEAKIKEQLVVELAQMRQRIAELEAAETERLSAEQAGKRAEEALRESEKRFRDLFESAPDAVFVQDFDGYVLDVNPAACRLHGMARGDLIGKNVSELVPPDKRGEALRNFLQLAQGELGHIEGFSWTEDGRAVPVEIRGSRIDYLGEQAVLLHVRDITERLSAEQAGKQAEEALRRRNSELAMLNRAGQALSSTLDLDQVLATVLEETRCLLDVVAGSVWLTDPPSPVLTGEGRGFAVSASRPELGAKAQPNGGGLVCRQAVGPQSEAVRGWRLAPGEGIAGWVARHGESLIVPDAWTDERYFKGVDQQTGLALRSILAVPFRFKGNVIGVLQVVDTEVGRFQPADLTLVESLATNAAIAIENARLHQEVLDHAGQLEQRVQERTAELSAANEELARTLRLKDEFLATMSHELRTPLNAILGMAEILWREFHGPLNERQLKSVRTIETSGRHLLHLINDILDVSTIEAGEMELELGPVSAEPVCRASLQLVEQQAQARRLRVTLTIDSVVTTLRADERRLKQILVNLLDNAVKFTPDGGAVGLEMRGGAAGQKVHFTVWDTGIGIAEEDVGRLFQPFVQLDGSLSRRYEGAGLGLWLVYRLAKMHGGSVSVESEVGKGSRFTVSLPWAPGLPTEQGR